MAGLGLHAYFIRIFKKARATGVFGFYLYVLNGVFLSSIVFVVYMYMRMYIYINLCSAYERALLHKK